MTRFGGQVGVEREGRALVSTDVDVDVAEVKVDGTAPSRSIGWLVD